MKEKEKCMGNIPIEDKKAARYIIIFMTVAIVIFSAISLLLEKSVNLKESELSSIMSNMQNSVSGMIENEDIKKISPGAQEYIKNQMQGIDKDELTKKTYNEIEKYRKKIYWIRSGIKVIIFVGAALLILRKEVKIRSEKEIDINKKEVIKEKASGLKELLKWPKKIPKLVYYILGLGIILIIIVPQVADKFVNIDQIADTIHKKGMNKKNIEKEAQKYTSRLIVRLTPQLHKEIAEYAALCGLTTSAYARKRLEGKYPKQRLTDKEMEALNSLSDARGDIQKLFGFLKGRPLTERENILRSEIFMKRWRTSAEVILNRMIEIEKYLTQ